MTKHPKFNPSRIVAGMLIAGASASLTPAALAQDEGAVLEEVMVTARKTAESMQSIPVAVTAFSGETINDLIMRDIRELEGMVPNVVIDSVAVAPGAASLYIRGVGTQEVEKSFDPAVGVVIDGVPLSFVNGSMANTYDFQSIEVLRGPQGTLFGKNTTGGVFNITRTRPTGELGLSYELTAGNDGREDVKGVFNFPLGNMLAGKIGYSSQEGGGSYKNITLEKEVGNRDNQEVTATLLFTPVESFEALFTYTNYKDENDGIGLKNLASLTAGAPVNDPELVCAAFGALGGCAGDEALDEYTQDYFEPIDFEADTYTLRMDWELGMGTITSITGYQETDESVPTDFDGSPVPFFHAVRDQEAEQKSTELRFASNDSLSENFDFVTGLFWAEDEYALIQNTAIAFGSQLNLANNFHEKEAWAIFGEAHYTFADKWTVTAGGRYTEEEKDYSGILWSSFDGGANFLFQEEAGGKKKWDEATYKLGLDYALNDDVLTYFSFTQGFRSGGFNGRNSNESNIGPYDPEYVDNYEIGMKGDFLDNTLRFNLAAFYVDYQDKQEEVIQEYDGASVTVVNNAATVESQGIEGELTWVATENFQINANFGYLDASYDEYIADLNGDGTATDNSHIELRRTPEWTAGVSGLYSANIGPGTLSLFANYRYTDEYWTDTSNDPRGLLDERAVLDATISYNWEWDTDRNVKISLFGRDLTDELAYNSSVTIPGLISFSSITGGREYGMQISGNF
ncbi:TonB-dependent receptor [Halieaceae bacterium IMCC14734]|uniref:TonB-dependent receptor n=1 Tax=Candidatus Litorirhabdus singularis TaxID=2518993 RepID=A0ABT3TE85_9GAMM|nr:TonB-dependent receptor [Candidatus Litorirhabdus singularis]MCX2980135.1 TonB-dependent receptor [Candidatus Litorirhabdus singularis]